MSEDYEFFMKLDVSPYIGEWVAVCNNRVVSHSTSFKKVFKEAKEACGSRRPFIALVPKQETRIL